MHFEKFICNCILHTQFNNGNQYMFHFNNGYGASVIRHKGSYGYGTELWELAIKFWDNGEETMSGRLLDGYEQINGVYGWLTDNQVEDMLKKIKEFERV